jgi:hypothetical protein
VKHMVRGSTVVLITPSTSRKVALVVDFLIQRGLKPILVLLDAATFGGSPGADVLIKRIKLMGIPCRIIQNETDLSVALSNG